MPTKAQLEAADKAMKEFDWAGYEAMSDEEIRAHWAWDPDMTWPTEEELKEFKLVTPATDREEPPQAAE